MKKDKLSKNLDAFEIMYSTAFEQLMQAQKLFVSLLQKMLWVWYQNREEGDVIKPIDPIMFMYNGTELLILRRIEFNNVECFGEDNAFISANCVCVRLGSIHPDKEIIVNISEVINDAPHNVKKLCRAVYNSLTK
jgi:hypothetical protein